MTLWLRPMAMGIGLALAAWGCGSSDDTAGRDVGGTGAASGAQAGVGGSSSIGAGGTAAGGHSSTEICDGIDNDGNGIIDDVDVGHDGICDCLLIATLGVPGTWGQGDVFAAWLSSRSNFGAADLNDQVL